MRFKVIDKKPAMLTAVIQCVVDLRHNLRIYELNEQLQEPYIIEWQDQLIQIEHGDTVQTVLKRIFK